MLVKFEKISIKGFLSIGEAEIELADQGMVYVTGKNNSPGNQDSNGAGKSTIFEAIMYALTGTTLRGTKDVVNIYWKGYTEVALSLSVDDVHYDVIRTRNHPELKNNLRIYRDGQDISGVGLKKSEDILKNELGQLSSSLVSSVIILGQGLPNKFTDLSPIARKDRLEELSQSSEFIGEFKTRLTNFKDLYTQKSNDNNMRIARTETEITMNEQRVSVSVRKLEELKSSEDDISLLNNQLSDEDKSIETLNERMITLSTLRRNTNDSYNSVTSERMIKSNQVTQSTNDISRLMNEIANLSESVCPTCHQPITSSEDVKNLRNERESRIISLQGTIDLLRTEIQGLSEKEKLFESKLRKMEDSYQNIQVELNQHNKSRLDIQGRIEKISSTSDELTTDINIYSSKIADEKAELNSLSSTRGVYDLKLGIIDYLTKKSSKEFRSFMLIGVVDYLNTKLSYYSNKLFGTDRLSLVLDGNRISILYDNRAYENLSGGERQRADLAMQFSLRDMLINSLGFNCNLLIIDEGFDNLDSSGVSSLVSVINDMTSIDSVFTISHHTLSIPFDRTIEVVKGMDKVSTVHEKI